MLQKHRRWITRFLLISVVMTMLGTAYAQEDDVLFIPFTGVSDADLPIEAERLLSAASEQVSEVGIEVVYEQAIAPFNFEQAHLVFFGESGFFFALEQGTVSAISPMLQDRYGLISIPYSCDQCMDDFNFTVQALTAYLLYEAGDYDNAESILRTLANEDIIENQLRYDVLFVLGNISILQSDYEQAGLYYEMITDGGVTSIAPVVNWAWAAYQIGNQEDAFARLNEHLEATNVEVDTHRYLDLLIARARLYALTFDYDSAIADMDTAIEIAEANDLRDTTLAELYTTHGEIIFLIYEWDRVEDNFDMAIEIAPSYAPAYFQRGILFYTVARREDAQADFEMYLELAPDGIYAEQATSYIESIEIELEALDD